MDLLVTNFIFKKICFRNHALSPLTQLLIALRYYAMGSMLIVAGDFGGIHKSTTSTVIRQVSRVIASLAPHYLKMPQNEEDLRKAKQDFLQIARFPNLIGAIDCTHVRISSPGMCSSWCLSKMNYCISTTYLHCFLVCL